MEIHRKADKEIRNLPEEIRKKVIKLLISLQKTPYPFREYDLKKIRGLRNVYRVRIGEYRISYYVNDKIKKIVILEVKPRGEAYRDLKHRHPV